ncbi:MAG: hypothetical protein Q4C55_10040, partial [Eubacterium sp.]|nr:hypothetical protein [Eubacterium sp.]
IRAKPETEKPPAMRVDLYFWIRRSILLKQLFSLPKKISEKDVKFAKKWYNKLIDLQFNASEVWRWQCCAAADRNANIGGNLAYCFV